MSEVDERTLFSRGPVVVFKWRNAPGWPVEYVSTNAEEVLGHSREAFYAGDVAYADVMHADDLERVAREVTDAVDSEVDSFVHEPYRIQHPDGEVRWLHDVTQILRGDDGTPTHYLGYVVDITDRMLAEEEKRSLERQLFHAQKLESLGVLAGGVAHDFNNLLTGILGEAALARRRLGDGNDEVAERLAQVEALALRAAELTGQLLAYSGKGKFVITTTDLTREVREMSSMLETVISKKAELMLELEKVPAIRGDQAQVRQVVMNLITNASDALEERNGTIIIRTGVADVAEADTHFTPPLAPGRYVILEVVDDGVGLDDDTRARMFEPFFTTKIKGRGLGTSAIVGILRGHGGGIRVRSQKGHGAQFTVAFPASEEAAQATTISPPDEAFRGSGTVLIVDDVAAVRRLAEEVLSDMGFATMSAADGQAAVELVEKHDFVLVLLDMTMPVLDGAETLVALRAINATMPVVMSSGYDKAEAISRFRSEQIAGFIQKPYLPKDLELVVRKALTRAERASSAS